MFPRKPPAKSRGVGTLVLVGAVLIGAAAVARAAPKLDVSKLKPGDKLEAKYGTQWEPVEFVSKFSDQIVHVKRKDWKIPVGALVSNLRPAKKTPKTDAAGGAAQDAPPQEDPFQTEEERAASRKPRTWVDPTGKFKTEATFLRADDEQVILKRADGKEVSVPLAKLGDADRQYVAALTGAHDGDDDSPDAAAEDGKADERGIELTETNLNVAESVDLAPVDTWGYQPDAAPEATLLRKVRVPLRAPTSIFDKPTDVILLPGEKKAFVVFVDHSPGNESYISTVQACDLAEGKMQAAGVFARGAAPIDISPDGKAVLARTVGFGFGVQAELRLYERNGSKVTPMAAWIPYVNGPADASPGHDADVKWAQFLDPDHVIAINEGGTLSLWETPKLRPVYQANGLRSSRPALSPGGRYVALATEKGIAILQASDGKVVGRLAADASYSHRLALAFSADGKRLALVQDMRRVRVWDLTTRKLERDFSVEIKLVSDREASVVWVDNDHLLVEGGTLVDLEHYMSVWTYTRLAGAREYQGRLWFVESDVRREAVLTSSSVPSQAIRDKWSKKSADELLIVKPGMEIAIDLPADAASEEVRQQITESLTERGMKVMPQANLRLVGTIGPGQTRTVQYQTRGAFGRREVTPQTVTETVLTLSMNLGPETVWKHVGGTSAPLFLHLKEGQTIDQAISEHMQTDSKAFQYVWVPVYVARPNPDAKADTSPYPSGG